MIMRARLLAVSLGAALLFPLNAAMAFNPPDQGTAEEPLPCSADCLKGPAPTNASLEAATGPFSVATIPLAASIDGFGGGTVHYPENIDEKMGLIVIGPGFLYPESSIKWWGPKLASHGFIVTTISFTTGFVFPDVRADQYDTVFDYVIGLSEDPQSPIYDLVDTDRLGLGGWSMGGGATLKLATEKTLKALVPMAPWYSGSLALGDIKAPTLIFACENDIIAPVNNHASPFYEGIDSSLPKAFLNVAGASHFCVTNTGGQQKLLGKYGIAWFKRFLDDDTRYQQFLCGPNHTADSDVTEYRDNCSAY